MNSLKRKYFREKRCIITTIGNLHLYNLLIIWFLYNLQKTKHSVKKMFGNTVTPGAWNPITFPSSFPLTLFDQNKPCLVPWVQAKKKKIEKKKKKEK